MNFTFHLIDQPWIPCLFPDGRFTELSLQDTFEKAHQLREIRSDSPLETVVLYRLLLVILHRVFGPANVPTWRSLWDQRETGFELPPLLEYLSHWKHKFDLLDVHYPFFQVVDEKQLGKIDTINKMITRLAMDSTLFEHTLDHPEVGAVLSLPQAARALLAIQGYGVGYQFFKDAPLTGGVTFLIQGDTLCETLLLNMIRYPQEEGEFYSDSNDRPVWEHENPFVPLVDGKLQSRDVQIARQGEKEIRYVDQTPLGYLDYLTWQNRKIRLICEDGCTIRLVAWSPGIRLKPDVLDPMKSYKARENGWRPISLTLERALWRDFDTLLNISVESKSAKPVSTLIWLAMISRRFPGLLPKAYRLTCFSLVKDKAKLELIRCEETPLPREYLEREDLVQYVSAAIELAEKVGRLVRRCAFLLAWLILKPSAKRVEYEEGREDFMLEVAERIDGKITRGQNNKSKDLDAQKIYKLYSSFGTERSFWGSLEVHFYRFLQDVPQQPDLAMKEWRGVLKRNAFQAFSQSRAVLKFDPTSLRALVEAEARFNTGLARLLNDRNVKPKQGDSIDATN